MDPTHAAKRARLSTNPFEVLPDVLVQRIMSLVEARHAWEVARLQQVDRRFRRVMRDVDWEMLSLAGAAGTRPEAHAIGRMKDRVRRGDFRGARSVALTLDLLVVRTGNSVIGLANDVSELLAALAVAPVQLERLTLWGMNITRSWPSDEDQVRAGLVPRSLQDFGSSIIVALSPAKALRYLKASMDFAFPVMDACVKLRPYCVPGATTLRELVVDGMASNLLKAEQVATMARRWPTLQRVVLALEDGTALAALAAFPALEAVNVVVKNTEDIDRAVAELAAVAAASTRLRELCEPHFGLNPIRLGPQGVAAALSLRSLQKLSMEVDSASAPLISGLAALEQLQALNLDLRLSGSEDEAAALLTAASAGLEKAPALESLFLEILDENGVGRSSRGASGLVSLLRAARPALIIFQYQALRAACALPEFLREVALCGPKLNYAGLAYYFPDSADVSELAPFQELVALSEDRLPDFKLSIAICNPQQLRQSAGILESWFHRVPAIEVNR